MIYTKVRQAAHFFMALVLLLNTSIGQYGFIAFAQTGPTSDRQETVRIDSSTDSAEEKKQAAQATDDHQQEPVMKEQFTLVGNDETTTGKQEDEISQKTPADQPVADQPVDEEQTAQQAVEDAPVTDTTEQEEQSPLGDETTTTPQEDTPKQEEAAKTIKYLETDSTEHPQDSPTADEPSDDETNQDETTITDQQDTPDQQEPVPTENDGTVQDDGNTMAQSMSALSDPAVTVYCDWLPTYSCGQSVACSADISNTASAQVTTEGLVATIEANNATITSIDDDGALDCSLNQGTITCDGVELSPSQLETVVYRVTFDNCPCGTYTATTSGTVSATNGDVNYTNNSDDYTFDVEGPACNQCNNPIETLSIDSHGNDEVVTSSPQTITGTVEGGVASVTVSVNGTDYSATINGTTWTVTVPLQQGDNDIWVTAVPTDPDCDVEETSINLKYQPVQCVDPITDLTIDSHTNNETVTSSPVTLTGTVDGGVNEIVVVVNGTNFQATINGNEWTVTVPLDQGTNDIRVVATPNDPDCDIVEEGIYLNYQPAVCQNPITDLSIDSHDYGDLVGDSPVTITGTAAGGVNDVTVYVNGQSQTTTVNGTTWSATVPLISGSNDIQVIATPSDPACDEESVSIALEYQPDLCEAPITNLTIDSHTNDEVVTSSPITVTGTVEGGVDHVTIMLNGENYAATVNGTTRSATVPLEPGDNDLRVVAYSTDDDCDFVEVGVNIVYDAAICEDPITDLTIDSHTNNEVVTSSPQTIVGTVQGGVDTVIVTVNGTDHQATIQGTTRTVTVPLQQGDNDIVVTAYPNDTDCDTVVTSINLKYQPVQCVDPITDLTIDSHDNNETVTSSPVTLTGTVEGGVEEVIVVVNGTNYTATLNGNEWSVTVPLDQGDNDIWVIAYPEDDDCDIVEEGINLNYNPAICEDPITDLAIDSHTNNEVVTSSPQTITGTVEGGVEEVIVVVNGTNYTATLNGNEWSVTVPLDQGDNDIRVIAHPEDDDCDIVEEGINLKYQPVQCVDPITDLTIDSHTNNEVVTSSPQTITGTVAGGVDVIFVSVNGNNYQATIQGTTRTVTVPLQQGDNDIRVIAHPEDDDCDIVEEGINLKYQPVQCVDPITDLTIDSHDNNETVTSSPVTLTGTVEGGVEEVIVVVNGTNYTATLNGNEWSVTVPLDQGDNDIWVIAYPEDDDCDIVEEGINLKYQPVQCVDPITDLTIDSHDNNETVTSSPVTLTGTVEGGVEEVIVVVNGTNYTATLNGNEWSVTVPLDQGDNDIWVIAYPEDDDCDIVEEGINLNYNPAICEDPITNLTIESHDNNEIVTSSSITLTGIVEGGVDQVVVSNGFNNYVATINGTTWTVTVPLTVGENDLTVTAVPSDQDCTSVTTDITIKRVPDQQCVDPITDLTIDSHDNNETVSNSPVELTGTVEGGVEEVIVVVNGTNYTATLNGNEWSVTVPLDQGANDIWVIAYPDDDDCDIVEEGINLNYAPGICEDPITSLTIDSHTRNQIVTGDEVTLTGTVEGGVDQVIVMLNGQNYPATINGTTWSVTVPLQQGENGIRVTAHPTDDDCEQVTADITIKRVPDQQCVDPITSLTVSSHTDGQTVSSSPVELTGTVEGGVAQIVLVVNGTTYPATINGTIWTATVPLQLDDNQISLIATPDDSDCDQVTTALTLTYSPEICEDPITGLTVTSPADGATVQTGTVLVEGTAEGGVASVEVNGVVADLTGTNWASLVDLQEGVNTIDLVALPSDQNCTDLTTSISVTYETDEEICEDPVSIIIEYPDNGDSTDNSSIRLEGYISGDLTAPVRVEGDEIEVTSSGEFEDVVGLSRGSNKLTVVAGEGICETSESVTVSRYGGGGGGNNYCGDGKVRYGEECDDGNNRNGDGCNYNCKLEDPVCGNGVIEYNEQCDDGNRRDGDGCNEYCELEDDLIGEIRKKKIRGVISRIGTSQPPALQLPPILPETGQTDRPTQPRVAAPTW